MIKFEKWWEQNQNKIVPLLAYSGRTEEIKLLEIPYSKEVAKFVFEQFEEHIRFLNDVMDTVDQM